MIKAVILGGHSKETLQNKVLYTIRGKPIIQYVVRALEQSQYISEMVIIGDVCKLKPLKNGKVTTILQDTASLADNVLAGVEYFQGNKVLIAAGDIPFLTTEAVEDFVLNSLEQKADFCYAVIPEIYMKNKYPLKRKTYVKLKNGKFAGGNLFIVDSSKIIQMMELGNKMLQHRKHPWQMCRLLGISFLIKLLTGCLSIEELEFKVNQLTGIKAKAIISHYPEIGNDIDKPEDLKHIQQHILEQL
jgi:CTP:molybdopterin cytidylyltransferase MocA